MRVPTSNVTWCASLLIFLAIAAGSGSAQGFKWWQQEDFRRELGLTTDQRGRLEEIFQSSVPTLRNQKKALDRAEAALEQLIETGDDASVMEQVNVVEAARADLSKSRTVMLLRMRRILTSDQRVKLAALHQTWGRDPKRSSGRTSSGRGR